MVLQNKRFAVWLIPAETHRLWLAERVQALAANHNLIPFEPHVTIFSGPSANGQALEKIRQALKDVAAETRPMVLKIKTLEASEEFFRSLFIVFEENHRLRHLHQRLQSIVLPEKAHELAPHLSLLYADLSLDAKKRAAAQITIDHEEILFTGLKIVVPAGEKGWRDIRGWKTISGARLGLPGNKIRAALFDFGGVLATEGFRDGLGELARRQGLDPRTMAETGREIVHRTGYLTGRGSEQEFWQQMRLQTGLRGSDYELSARILARFILRPGMLEIVRRLRGLGIITAIVSDQTDWLERLDRRDHFYCEFDYIFNSYRLGKSKRDSSLFDEVAQKLDITPQEALFIDDTSGHVARAENRGMCAIRFAGEDQIRNEIEAWLDL